MSTPARAQRAATEEINEAARLVVRPSYSLRKAARSASSTNALFQEIGTSGLRQFGGFVLEEWLQALAGRRAAWVWREMMDNSPIVGAVLFAIKWLTRGVEWRVTPGTDADAAEFVESCMGDMSHTWGDFISEVQSMFGYGWAYHELVYKRRSGPQPEIELGEDAGAGTTEDDSAPASSQYSDGRIGWRKMPGRAQETLLRWHFDGYSGIQALEQIDYHGGDHIIPIVKALLFRTETTRNNPEGRSLLRNAYTSYYTVKNIQAIEAIGIERDLAGIPVAKAPENCDIFAPGNAQLFAKVTELVTSIRRDEYEGVVMPSGWILELLNSGGSRQIDTDAVVRRYEQRIATSMLADFVLLGQDAVGSYAMADVKSQLFGMAMDGMNGLISEVLNRYAIPRLLTLNGLSVDEDAAPRIEASSAGRIDLAKVAQFLEMLSGAGAPIPWSHALMESLFEGAALPIDFDDPIAPPSSQAPRIDPQDVDALEEPAPAAPGEEPPTNTAKNTATDTATNSAKGKAAPLAKAEVHAGAMVALYPPDDVARALAQDGGEPPADLHLTLAYLGAADSVQDPGALRHAVARWAADTPPLHGQVSGTGRYTAGPAPVAYASADIPGLPAARQALVSRLASSATPASEQHGFAPHITLAYDARHADAANHPLHFDHATLSIAGRREHFPLAGVALAKAQRVALAKADARDPVVNRLAAQVPQLERHMHAAMSRELDALGAQAQLAYMAVVSKAAGPDDEALTRRVMGALHLKQWMASVLRPLYRRHYQRVLDDTVQSINAEINLGVRLPDPVAKAIVSDGGTRAGLLDIQAGVRDAILAAIAQGREAGEGPAQIARRIRSMVPAGRFVHAGSAYRARLIARTETLHAQRLSALQAYAAAPSVTAVRVSDGVLGPPRSDPACIARDGDVMSTEQALGHVTELHPQCTLSFEPIVASAPTPTVASGTRRAIAA